MNIGLYGGTFDPIHTGHLLLAEWIRERLAIDQVIFVPAFVPPHKKNQPITAPEMRYRMIELAIGDNPAFRVSDFEMKKGDVSYSFDTIMHFRQHYQISRDALYFLIGSDSLMEFDHWYRPDGIVDNCRIVVYRRSDFNLAMVRHQYVRHIMLMDNPIIDISSSDIRTRVAQGSSIKYLVAPAVEAFILSHSLYKNKS